MPILTFHSKQIQGKGIGNKSMVPTINLVVPEPCDLPFGVYAARVTLQYPHGYKTLHGALHYGPRPTTQDPSPSLEVHILDAQDFQTDYNAEDIRVEVAQYIRDIKKFSDFAQLREQIQKDIVRIQEVLGYMKNITIADSTSNDSQSQIRGLGRYVQALNMALADLETKRTFINPFFNLIAKPEFDQRLLSKDQKIAVIHDVIPLKHSQFPWMGLKGRVWVFLNRILLRLFDRIVTDSESGKRDIEHFLHIPLQKIRVAYPYSALQEVTPDDIPSVLPHSLTPYTYLLYVGDVNWHKNIVTLAKVAIEANVKLVCVGGAFVKQIQNHAWLGDLQEFTRLAGKYPELIIRTGFVDDLILGSLYKNALANILISLDEGFGYSYIEAGHFQTPSILTDAPIFHEISGEKGAVFVDPQNITDIKNQILDLQKDRDRRRSLGIEAQIQSRKYSREEFSRQWNEILNY